LKGRIPRKQQIPVEFPHLNRPDKTENEAWFSEHETNISAGYGQHVRALDKSLMGFLAWKDRKKNWEGDLSTLLE